MKSRVQLIQYLIDRFSLKSYLEVGIQFGQTFDQIKCEKKMGVEPNYRQSQSGIYVKTSDEFFDSNAEIFDIVFIDGLHLYEQAVKDIINSWNTLSVGGFIILHDCLPKYAEMCERTPIIQEWTGDVWKAVIWFRRAYPDVPYYVLDMDYGCGIIRKISDKNIKKLDVVLGDWGFAWLQEHLNWMNIRSEYEGFHCDT